MEKYRFKQLLESTMGNVKPLVMENDCSKLTLIPKSGNPNLSGGGTPQSDTWLEDIKKIGNATYTYMFDGELLDAMKTQKKCKPAENNVTYSEFKRKDGTSYTMIGID